VKKYLVIAALVIMAGAGVYLLRRNSTPATQVVTPALATAKVEYGSIRLVVASTGRVVANLDVDIKCKASGEVCRLPFDVSDTVKKGDLILELDPVDEQRNLDRARVALSASQARLVQAQQNLLLAQRRLETDRRRAEAALESARARAKDTADKAERLAQLLAKKLASQEEYDTAATARVQAAADLATAEIRLKELEIDELALKVKEQDVVLAEAQVKADCIAVSDAEQRLRDTKVVAPMDGVVAARNVQIGQIVSSGISNVGGGTTVMTLSDLSHIFVLASVDETDIGKVAVGQRVIVTADAYPGRRFPGRVVRIATRGVNISNVVTFEVKIEVLGEQRALLKPEMTANVEIVAAERKEALLVPAEAVTRKGERYTVEVVSEGGTPQVREVQVGITADDKTEIISGLTAGETIRYRKGQAESRWRRQQGGPPPMFPMVSPKR